jgi:hypothetical protein
MVPLSPCKKETRTEDGGRWRIGEDGEVKKEPV